MNVSLVFKIFWYILIKIFLVLNDVYSKFTLTISFTQVNLIIHQIHQTHIIKTKESNRGTLIFFLFSTERKQGGGNNDEFGRKHNDKKEEEDRVKHGERCVAKSHENQEN